MYDKEPQTVKQEKGPRLFLHICHHRENGGNGTGLSLNTKSENENKGSCTGAGEGLNQELRATRTL